MHRLGFYLGLLLCGSSPLCGYSAPPGVGAVDQSANDLPGSQSELGSSTLQWIGELASPEYSLRREAFMKLWEAGTAALPAVRAAAADADQQIAGTARVLELLLKLEIRPRDNAELAELLQMSRQAMHRAIMSLAEKGHWRLATELLRSNESVLDAYRKSGRSEWLCMVVQSAFDQGDALLAWPIVQQLLDPVQSQWIAARMELDFAPSAAPADVDSQALALLFRNQFEQAWALNPSPSVQLRIIFLSGRWEWLQNDSLRALYGSGDSHSIAGRAKQAAYAYLAEDIDHSQELLAEVLTELDIAAAQQAADPVANPLAPPTAEPQPPLLPAAKPNALQQQIAGSVDTGKEELLVALLICGQGDAVHKLLKVDDDRKNLVYFGVRLDYDRALSAFGLKSDFSDYDAWLDKTLEELLPTLKGAGPARSFDNFQHLCELASLMVAMGRVDEGLRLYGKLIDATHSVPEAYREQTWTSLANLGRQTQFRSHLIRLLDRRDSELTPEVRKRFFTALFPEWYSIAPALWQTAPPQLIQRPSASDQPEQLESNHANAEPPKSHPLRPQLLVERRWELMERLWRYDRGLISENPSAPLVENWLKNAMRDASQIDESGSTSASHALARIALHMGLKSLAMVIAKSGKGRSAISEVAEVTMLNKDYAAANVLWESAIRSDPWRHDWILQDITALAMVGEQEKSQLLERSRWLRPLAVQRSGAAYWTMAVNLQEEGAIEQARDYAYAAFAQLDVDNPQLLPTGRTYADILQELEDYARSADVHRATNLMLLNQSGTGYQLSTLQHVVSEEFLARAVAELDMGNVEEALRAVERFEHLRPAGIEICEHTYRRLLKNGQQSAAEQLLERCSQRMLEHLVRWPKDAGSHNNLAWMFARCNVRLDEALEHAERAVALADSAPTYIDTLAETHYRLGHYDEALRFAEKCAALDPRHDHYRKQLHRFRQVDRTQATPVE